MSLSFPNIFYPFQWLVGSASSSTSQDVGMPKRIWKAVSSVFWSQATPDITKDPLLQTFRNVQSTLEDESNNLKDLVRHLNAFKQTQKERNNALLAGQEKLPPHLYAIQQLYKTWKETKDKAAKIGQTLWITASDGSFSDKAAHEKRELNELQKQRDNCLRRHQQSRKDSAGQLSEMQENLEKRIEFHQKMKDFLARLKEVDPPSDEWIASLRILNASLAKKVQDIFEEQVEAIQILEKFIQSFQDELDQLPDMNQLIHHIFGKYCSFVSDLEADRDPTAFFRSSIDRAGRYLASSVDLKALASKPADYSCDKFL